MYMYMYLYIYIYMYIYIYISRVLEGKSLFFLRSIEKWDSDSCLDAQVYICIHIYTNMYIHIYVYINIFIHIYVYVYIYIHTYAQPVNLTVPAILYESSALISDRDTVYGVDDIYGLEIESNSDEYITEEGGRGGQSIRVISSEQVCMYVYIYVFIYICLYVYIYIYRSLLP
jgi:hypothetical protein